MIKIASIAAVGGIFLASSAASAADAYVGVAIGSQKWNATDNNPAKYELETHTETVEAFGIEGGMYYSRGRFGLELTGSKYALHGVNGDATRNADGSCRYSAGKNGCKANADGNDLFAVNLHAVATFEPFAGVYGFRPYVLQGVGATYLYADSHDPEVIEVSGSAVTLSFQLGLGVVKALGAFEIDISVRHLRALPVDVDGHRTDYLHYGTYATVRYRF